MLLGAINYNNSMGYALTFLLGSMAMISLLHTHQMLIGLKIATGKVKPVFVGETVQFQLWIENNKPIIRNSLVGTTDSVLQLKHLSSSHTYINNLINIAANQRVQIEIPTNTSKRGSISLGKFMLYTRFPFGLFHAWSYIYLDMSTWVYPRPLGNQNLPSGQQYERLGTGNLFKEGNEDFMGHRNYQLGDSPRHIDWKAVAREQDWMVKQFTDLNATTVWLDGNTLSSNIESTLSQLCLWILIAEQQKVEYGLKLATHIIKPASGEQHREQCLRILALYT